MYTVYMRLSAIYNNVNFALALTKVLEDCRWREKKTLVGC